MNQALRTDAYVAIFFPPVYAALNFYFILINENDFIKNKLNTKMDYNINPKNHPTAIFWLL